MAVNQSHDSQYRGLSKKQGVLKEIQDSEIELTPRQIHQRTKINHSTVKNYCRRLLEEGKIIQPYTGCYCSKIAHSMIFAPLRVHNVILVGSAPWLDFSDDLVEFTGGVKVRVQFGLQRHKVTVRISCDSGMDRNACLFALSRGFDIVKARSGYVLDRVVVKTFEVNRDYQGYRLDGGVHCYTQKGLFDVIERIYQKEENVLRHEFKVSKEVSLEQFQVLMKGGVTGFNLQNAVFALAQDQRNLTEAVKFMNEKMMRIGNILEELIKRKKI